LRSFAEGFPQARFPAGTFARIEHVLRENEYRIDFVREAVERELKRRERASPRGAGKALLDFTCSGQGPIDKLSL
jgi:hypothetical protein